MTAIIFKSLGGVCMDEPLILSTWFYSKDQFPNPSSKTDGGIPSCDYQFTIASLFIVIYFWLFLYDFLIASVLFFFRVILSSSFDAVRNPDVGRKSCTKVVCCQITCVRPHENKKLQSKWRVEKLKSCLKMHMLTCMWSCTNDRAVMGPQQKKSTNG
jgi:hypothetical protein